MIYVYIILSIVSVSALAADCILRYMERIKSFDFHKKLFDVRGNTIPIHKFLPESLTMLLICIAALSGAGFLFSFMGMEWYFSLPCSVASGLCVCFAVQYLARNAVDMLRRSSLPKGEEAGNLDGYCLEKIGAGDCGRVCLFHKDREFEVNAGNAGEVEIDEGEKVVSLYENDGFYYVVRVDKIFDEIVDED